MTEVMKDGRVVDCLLQLEQETRREARETLLGHLARRMIELMNGYPETLVQFWRCVKGCWVPAGLKACRNCGLTPSGLTLEPPAEQMTIAEVAVGSSVEQEGNAQVDAAEAMQLSEPQAEVSPPDQPSGSNSDCLAALPALQTIPSVPEEEKVEKPCGSSRNSQPSVVSAPALQASDPRSDYPDITSALQAIPTVPEPRRSSRISRSSQVSAALSTSDSAQSPLVPVETVKRNEQIRLEPVIATKNVKKASQKEPITCLKCGALYNYGEYCNKCGWAVQSTTESKSATEPTSRWSCSDCNRSNPNNKTQCQLCGKTKKK